MKSFVQLTKAFAKGTEETAKSNPAINDATVGKNHPEREAPPDVSWVEFETSNIIGTRWH